MKALKVKCDFKLKKKKKKVSQEMQTLPTLGKML